ncbi:hypothetical protein CEE37_04950 [candidate division LCP-89 bacterium B3_LCP]|uniref:3'-5' exonuclease DinG n=1 Tax=candidate division LCP-89 bacterium B3_LCP TaxID=2012998 RepID=A0A532V1C8_UNCL8|nr:MAG: hypothetical protein CEE37_04950 [candidate division LCP-89 bacterium B3_LCP]
MNSPAIPKLPPDLFKAMGLSSFVAFDLETTGLDASKERIIEVGAVRFQDGSETEHFGSLVSCPFPLQPFITELTGISSDMLTGKPAEGEVVAELLEFIGDDPVVGHNVNFDLSFLKAAFKRAKTGKRSPKLLAVDTALISRVLLPTLPSRSLSALGNHFNLDTKVKHRATEDARRTGQLLRHLLAMFSQVDIKHVDLLRRISKGMNHPSDWIFPAWADYLMQTSTVEGAFQPHRLSFLSDNILGKLPDPISAEAAEAQTADEDTYCEIDSDNVSSFFQPDGRLQESFHNYEFRPEQVDMASSIADILNGSGYLAVEAGTGIGKSLAYLVPSIYWAQANRDLGERVIVSTNTRNLQEQLFFKDLPTLTEALPVKFSAVLLKGRSNYLCKRRWENLTTENPIRLSSNERLAMLPLVLWADQTRTGDVAETGAFGREGSGSLWARIASDGAACRGRRCRHRNFCFHTRVRSAAGRAHVVVINHALLMSDLAAEHVPIGAYRTLVIDEAHHLERAASQHLGRELNHWMFQSWIRRVFDAENVPTGLLAQIILGLGAARSDHPLLPGFSTAVEAAADKVNVLKFAAASFFDNITEAFRKSTSQNNNSYNEKIRLRQPDEKLAEIFSGEPQLLGTLRDLDKLFKILLETLQDIPMVVLQRGEDWMDDLRGVQEELQVFKANLDFFLQPADANWVYWAELPRKSDFTATLYAAPLNAGEILKTQLFSALRCVMMTSATLTVADRFHYFLRKVGLSDEENAVTLKLGSPFDLPTQMLIGLPAYLPQPKKAEYEAAITSLIQSSIKKLKRGTLGLFTSHRTLRSVGQALESQKITGQLLIQGKNGTRDQLLRRFRNEPGSVLLGTDSFWEGIDVVGKALELLIVAKLPFEVPSEPLVEAKLEKIKAEGKDPFMYYTVPEAIIRLRQGIGRLIRSKTDRGAVLICDSRLATTRYGEAFMKSLPVRALVFDSQEETIRALDDFFTEGRKEIQENL